jgi:hypothetical protein
MRHQTTSGQAFACTGAASPCFENVVEAQSESFARSRDDVGTARWSKTFRPKQETKRQQPPTRALCSNLCSHDDSSVSRARLGGQQGNHFARKADMLSEVPKSESEGAGGERTRFFFPQRWSHRISKRLPITHVTNQHQHQQPTKRSALTPSSGMVSGVKVCNMKHHTGNRVLAYTSALRCWRSVNAACYPGVVHPAPSVAFSSALFHIV